MSIEYDLVCHKHKERFWVCSDGVSGPQNQLDSSKKLAAFIVTHECCSLNVIDEQNEDYEDYKQCDELKWEEVLNYDFAEQE